MPRASLSRPATPESGLLASQIGARLRTARQRAALTQQQLAGDRYTKAYVSALETGAARPSMAALNFFAGRLGIPPAQLLTDANTTWSRLEADANLAAGNWQAAADTYQGLLELAADRRERAELLRGLAEALCRLDQGAEAISVASEAADIFTRLGNEVDSAIATYWLASALYQRDNGEEAHALLRSLLDRTRAGLAVDADFQVRLLIALAGVELRAGRPAVAVTYLEEAKGLAADLDDRRRATFLFSLAIGYRESGDVEAAIRAGTQSLALYRAAGAKLEEASIANDLALAYLAVGNLRRATQLAAEARQRMQQLGDDRWLAHVAETEAQIALASGDAERAITLADDAIRLADGTANAKARTSALLTRARALAVAGRTDAADAAFSELAEAVRMAGPRARIKEVLGEWASLAAARGDHERAYALARDALHTDAQWTVDAIPVKE
jgi:tetratricopeptide (TPR) repeat protein